MNSRLIKYKVKSVLNSRYSKDNFVVEKNVIENKVFRKIRENAILEFPIIKAFLKF